MIAPPIIAGDCGTSFINIQAHNGPKTASVIISIPTMAERVFLAPIVINIKPSPTCKEPAKNPKKISCAEIMIFDENKYPIPHKLKY